LTEDPGGVDRQARVAPSMAVYGRFRGDTDWQFLGRVKSADLDFSTSRENTEADAGLIQSYAGTRP